MRFRVKGLWHLGGGIEFLTVEWWRHEYSSMFAVTILNFMFEFYW